VRLIICNTRSEELVGDLSALSDAALRTGHPAAHRMLSLAHVGDVLVLPSAPPSVYLSYICGLLDVPVESLSLVVPPRGDGRHDLLTARRLSDPSFLSELREVLADKAVDTVAASFDDRPVLDLVAALGLESRFPGFPFSRQGGVGLANSKALFRAVATGHGVAIAEGAVVSDQSRAATEIARLLRAGDPVIVKQEHAGGGMGNVILSSDASTPIAGSNSLVEIRRDEDVTEWLETSWPWLTTGTSEKVVLETYAPGCTTVYVECVATERTTTLSGIGEIIMDPTPVGERVPPPTVDGERLRLLELEGLRLCDAYRQLGYRGRMSADAVVTPDGHLLFTEVNARMTGSTHLHEFVRSRLLTSGGPRALLERRAWAVPSFAAAVRRLEEQHLAFDKATERGVVLTADAVEVTGTVAYCIVAAEAAAAEEMEREVLRQAFS